MLRQLLIDRKEEFWMAERRQHPRYRIPEGDFEVFSRDSNIMGKLDNISQGGLGFHYSPVEGRSAESPTIDIMAKSPDPFFLPSVACKTRYDISVLAEDQTFTGAAIRMTGVQFFQLDEEQMQKLALFIKKYGQEPSEEID
jgi:hypothetical protein